MSSSDEKNATLSIPGQSESIDNENLSQDPPYTGFTTGRRCMILAIVTGCGFLGPLAGNIYIPILPLLKKEFNVSTTTINGTVAVFMAVFAVGTLLWAPMADFAGRKTLYITSMSLFLLANVLLTFLPKSIVALYLLRILQALGASSVVPVGAGTVADITSKQKRGKAISIFMLGPQVGPVIGPIVSLVSSDGNWRWCFGLLSIVTLFMYIFVLFLLPETLRWLVGNGNIYEKGNKFSWLMIPKLYQKKITDDKSYSRPPKPTFWTYVRLFKYLPVLLTSINGCLLFSGLYALNVTFNDVLKSDYHLSDLHISLSYICLGAGLISGSLLSGFISDRTRNQMAKRTSVTPEDRLPLQILGFLLFIVGFVCFGWCCQKHLHIVSIYLTSFIGCFGITWVLVTNTTYLTECSTGLPATNVAFGNLLRNAGAAISSAVIHRLISKMGYGWCFTGLALVNLCGLANVVWLTIKGSRWRNN